MSRLFALSGKPVVLKDHLSRVTLSIISRIVLGKKYFSESKHEKSIGYVKRMKALCKKFDRFHDHVIGEHKARKEAEKDFVPKDMVDLLLKLADDPNLEVQLTSDGVKGFIQHGGSLWTGTVRKNPLVAVLEPRLSDHLYEL
ncbi:hypothetical protein C3L33_19248, partial [Rhododendron williamsianum]